MEQDTQAKIEEMNAKLNAIYASVEKTRKYFLVTMWVTIAVFVLPLFGLIFVIPTFLNTYTQTLEGLL
ncbi:MAG: hypothetical protein ACJKSS_02860 [Patescibacteria group bacterium UBA2103]